MDLFERAARLRLRWSTNQGQLSSEELWQLSLDSLNTIAKAVNKQLRDEGEESFLSTPASRKSATHNDLRLDILKHVIAAKEQQEEDSKLRSERMTKISQLKELIARKAVEELEGKSVKELSKEIDKLKALV